MISVSQAEQIILSHFQNYGTESLPLSQCNGRVLAESLYADRDFPPFDRVAMDGIAIDFQAIEQDIKIFRSVGVQSAGQKALEIQGISQCVEIMTGAILSGNCDTIIRYEDLIKEGDNFILAVTNIKKGQNIHTKGKDKRKDELLVADNQIITPAIIQIAASIGKSFLQVKKLPKIAIISTGDELIDIDAIPNEMQIRRSNVYAIQSFLAQFHCPTTLFHLYDDYEIIKNELQFHLSNFDVIILSGGISAGKFDFIPTVLQEIGVQKHFHKVAQRPGKPFYFGTWEKPKSLKTIIFALPGNPLSTFMCCRRYVILWLEKSLGLAVKPLFATLSESITFLLDLQYFMPVKLSQKQNSIIATPLKNNGSGDFTSLTEADALIELPSSQSIFDTEQLFRVWEI